MIRTLHFRPIVLAAALLAGLALLVVADPGTAGAQTSTTLVSNVGFNHQGTRLLSSSDTFQAFTTGANPSGYVVTSVGTEITEVADDSAEYAVSIYLPNNNGEPGHLVAALSPPSSLRRGPNT